jgi:SAM-dependent methyltransferase
MSKVFDAYAAYYDLLYRDKDYVGETTYVHGLIQRYSPGAREVLELGCGTGGHALELTKLGYLITGVDLSKAMIVWARKRAERLPDAGLQFLNGDLREFRVNWKFDAVLALFHVMSYQTTNADISAAMATAAAHLAPGGAFIFDCWFGPGVLSDPPVTRMKRLEGDGVRITRIAEPIMHPNENRVDVSYEVFVEGPVGLEKIQETHPMRYLFTPEVDWLLDANGLHRVAVEEWLTGAVPGLMSWNVCFVAKR